MKKYLITILLVSIVTAVMACQNNKDRADGYARITMEEAVTVMEENADYILLDVRTQEEFAQGHIPGAVNIPNETIGTDDIVALPEKNQLILVYCRSGNRSKKAAAKLVAAGYTNVVEIGGIRDWTGETKSGRE